MEVSAGTGLVAAACMVVGLVGLVGHLRQGARLDPRRLVVGALVVAVGVAARVLVSAVNDGPVPATSDALRTAGRATDGSAVAELTARRLWLLGDLVAWPDPLPLAAPFGLPHLLIVLGVALVVRPAPPGAAGPRRLTVTDGRVWCRSDEGPVEVLVPGARLTTAAASFGVDVGPSGTVVIVVAGTLEVLASTPAGTPGDSCTVLAGHGLVVDAVDGPGPVDALTRAELAADQWIAPHLVGAGGSPRPVGPEPLWRRGPTMAGVVGGVVLAALVGATYLLQVVLVPSASMEPTYGRGDRLAVAKAVGAPVPGDVVVFERPAEVTDGPLLLVKRVVAVGGQTVDVSGGVVSVDGERLEGPDTGGSTADEPCGPVGTVVLAPGELYVMGDNRADSEDSRCFGPITTGSLVGTVVGRVWPPGRG